MAEIGAPISLYGAAVHPRCWCVCLCCLNFALENPEDGEMYLLVPAHVGSPGQSPESREMVVCVCVRATRYTVVIYCAVLPWKLIAFPSYYHRHRVVVYEQSLVMLNGWMTSRHRRPGNGDSAANELARALTCIRRDDVINAYLADVITKRALRDSTAYADRGSLD